MEKPRSKVFRKSRFAGVFTALLLLMAISAALPGATLTESAAAGTESISGTEPVSAAESVSAAEASAPGGYGLVSETDAAAFYVSDDFQSAAVLDRRTGHLWESSVDPERLTRKANRLWSLYIRSMFLFQYAAVTDMKGDIRTGSAAEFVTSARGTPIDGGIRIEYAMDTLKMRLAIELVLDGSILRVTIPESGIGDGEANNLVSVDLMPFFGAAADTDDGYYLYPNGAGELYRFKDVSLRQNSLKEYAIPYYSPQTVNIAEMAEDESSRAMIRAMLPSYGVKVGDSAFVTMLREGAAYGSLHIAPGGVAVSISRIFNSFTYRKSYGVYGSSISIAGGSQVFPLAVLLDAQRYTGDRVMEYCFLAGADADYSGMANTLRRRLQETGFLPSEPVAQEGVPVLLDVLGGIRQKKLFFSFYKKLTTFAQTRDMIGELTSEGVEDLIVNLRGWSRKGLLTPPYSMPASWKLGGGGGLRDLASYCKKQNVRLLLDVNNVDIFEGSGGYSLASDAARDPNNYMYTDPGKTRYLMSPVSLASRTAAILRYAGSVGASGVLFEKLGETLYSDHNRKHPSLAAETAETWTGVLEQTAQILGTAATTGGNLYAVGSSILLKDIPDRSVSVLFGDETVPFYQMVVHGSVLYSGSPVNLFYDAAGQKLRMIEYGYIPYYELTYVNSRELADTAYNELFSSEYESWKGSIADISREIKEKAGDIYNAYMIRHERLGQDVTRVTYSNGTALYFNYGDSAWTGGGITVPAGDFLAVRGGGNG